ncbi:aminoglycoside phosphotransferase family protein [Streptomyces sp. NBC_00102]|uniref:aminoglycoside phosphotransferase family protein n=1 Tax=Streptomyces sp. NBC_00102 TaxID=2975652 RepID=UPI00225220A4|nr:aminoglycoside phosphotransferase family protein [Streptomyces sp. NBC_00102]MCX5400432.1 aminoglycoside phosphotransferase family protein [Streptomyces sp. NBC_00102]
MNLARAAERLGLGQLLEAPLLLKDDEQGPVWKAATDSGSWVVKLNRPWGDFWLSMAAQAGALEVAAWETGVAMPEPQSTTLAEAGLWRPVGDGVYARAVRFIEGSHPTAPTSEALAAWAGGLVADLARCAIPADPAVDGDYGSYSRGEWEQWFAQAERLEILSAGQIRVLRLSVAQAQAMIEDQQELWRSKLVMHRDIRHQNVLTGSGGPVLLDFDSAGAQEPWWELVFTAFGLAGFGRGPEVPERRIVEACLSGYVAAGGAVGAVDESAFTGMFAGRVGTAAWQLWMACGHRGGSPEYRAGFARTLRESVEAMAVMRGAMRTWATWLAA